MKTLKEWASKPPNIEEKDRVFCIASEIEVQKEVTELIKLIQDGKVVFSRGI